jgi:phosphoserine aminotransferase
MINCYAGPAILPESAVLATKKALDNFDGTGVGLMEISHREPVSLAIISDSEKLLADLLGISLDEWCVMFCVGGATAQFSMVPMNLLEKGKVAGYINTGVWASKALAEASKFGETIVLGTSEDNKFRNLPEIAELPENCGYVHITSNNTIIGSQWPTLPKLSDDITLVVDASSDFLSRPIDLSQVGLIYASAQKNLGPAGVTVVVARRALLNKSSNSLPIMLNYRTFRDNQSVYNTPPVLPIFVVREVLRWIKDEGGLAEMEQRNLKKAKIIYEAIDGNSLCIPYTDRNVRSIMNATFNISSSDGEAKFIRNAKHEGILGLSGHKMLGGIRVNLYNAFSINSALRVAEYIREFQS